VTSVSDDWSNFAFSQDVLFATSETSS